MEISNDNIEKIGMMADRMDNLICAAKLPMPPQFHVTQLTQSMSAMSDSLKEIYSAVTGEKPWTL